MQHSDLLLVFWAALSFWVTGQIWLVQIVVYPLFHRVGATEYVGYHSFYSRRIPLPVILPGFASFFSPIALAYLGPEAIADWMHAVNITAGIVGLLVTVGLEIPRHAKLEKGGKDETTIRQLVRYNWPRTFSITTQAVVTLMMISRAFQPV